MRYLSPIKLYDRLKLKQIDSDERRKRVSDLAKLILHRRNAQKNEPAVT